MLLGGGGVYRFFVLFEVVDFMLLVFWGVFLFYSELLSLVGVVGWGIFYFCMFFFCSFYSGFLCLFVFWGGFFWFLFLFLIVCFSIRFLLFWLFVVFHLNRWMPNKKNCACLCVSVCMHVFESVLKKTNPLCDI